MARCWPDRETCRSPRSSGPCPSIVHIAALHRRAHAAPWRPVHWAPRRSPPSWPSDRAGWDRRSPHPRYAGFSGRFRRSCRRRAHRAWPARPARSRPQSARAAPRRTAAVPRTGTARRKIYGDGGNAGFWVGAHPQLPRAGLCFKAGGVSIIMAFATSVEGATNHERDTGTSRQRASRTPARASVAAERRCPERS